MTWIRVAIAVPYGLIIGSFLTVLVNRVPAGESIVAPRSRCPSCGTPITARDNVPVVSWVLLRGRCRSCGVRIPVRYPVTEIVTAALFAAAAIRYEDVWLLIAVSVFLGVLLALSLIDLEHKILPNRIVYPSLVAFPAYLVVARLAGAPLDLLDAVVGFLAYGGVMLLVAIVSPRGMGMGDVKLAAVMGLFLGRSVAPALLIGFATGALVGLVLIARRGASARKQAVPFGPFLALGGIVGLWFGSGIVDWYLSTFFHA